MNFTDLIFYPVFVPFLFFREYVIRATDKHTIVTTELVNM
jgi:hypothetical protein